MLEKKDDMGKSQHGARREGHSDVGVGETKDTRKAHEWRRGKAHGKTSTRARALDLHGTSMMRVLTRSPPQRNMQLII